MAEKKPNVFECVQAVSKLLGKYGIQKDGVNESQRFNFRGIDQVLDALNGPLTACGLVVFPSVKSIERSERVTKSGGTMTNTVMTVEYRLVSTHDSSEITCVFAGESSDSGDKGVSKALSMSFKYFAFQTFTIPVAGLDDSDSTTPPESIPAPAKKPGKKAPSKPEETPAAETEATPAAEPSEPAEEPEAPATGLSFEDGMTALAAVTTAAELVAVKATLMAFAKHPKFEDMKKLFLAKNKEIGAAK